MPRRIILWLLAYVAFPLVLAAILALCGCAPLPASIPARMPLPKVLTLVWSRDFNRSAVAAWEAQIVQRWPSRDVVAVFAHGTDQKPWRLMPDPPLHPMPVENAAAMLHTILPGRMVVVVSCNGSGSTLHTPDVAFARKRVWIHPGCDTRWSFDDNAMVCYVGRVGEFEVTK